MIFNFLPLNFLLVPFCFQYSGFGLCIGNVGPDDFDVTIVDFRIQKNES